MTTHQFFIRQSQIDPERRVRLEGADARHIRLVLRLESGGNIRLVDEKQNVHMAKLERVNRRDVIARLLDTTENLRLQTRLTIVQGIPKAPKTDLITQKLAELGAGRIIFAPTEFTSYPNAFETVHRRIGRLRKIAEAASKQCARVDIPEVVVCETLAKALEVSTLRVSTLRVSAPGVEAPGVLLLVASEKATCGNLRERLASVKEKGAVVVFIGPEGGLSGKETRLLEQNGATCFSLGHNILRTETAAIAATAIILYEMGEI